jgi:hypothetical protein
LEGAEFPTTGVLGSFGRTERQRRLLAQFLPQRAACQVG